MKDRYLLIVEDDADLRDMVIFALKDSGLNVIGAPDAAQAWAMIGDRLPDLILLDWMLPGVSGIDFLRRLRRNEVYRAAPVIMLTAKSDENDRVRGLEAGADDYLIKPFSVKELRARINAVMRRAAPEATAAPVIAGCLALDPAGHRVTVNDDELSLGPTEFRLLHFLMTRPDRVFSRRQLLDRVWGANVYVEERTVDVHVRRLRKALEPHRVDGMVRTVRGAGYCFSKGR